MKIFPYIALSCLSSCLFMACEDSTSTLGNSLVTSGAEVVVDSAFTIQGSSLREEAVLSRTYNQLLGKIDAKEFGSISADFVTQFMPSQQLDTVGVTVNDIDSVRLLMFYQTNGFTGDSLVPMGLKVYPLTRQLESPIYSNFNPAEYYNEGDCWSSQPFIYSAHDQYNDTLEDGTIYKRLIYKLPIEFGRKVFTEYLNNPSTFSSPQAFAQFFPGLYVKNAFGTGRITDFNQTKINFYYRKHAKVTVDDVERDTTYFMYNTYLAVTPEILSNNIIRYSMSSMLEDMVAQGQTLLVAPTGYNARIIFPGREIVNKYREDGGDMSVINTLNMTIPVESISNPYSIAPPANVLLVLEKDKEAFFAENKINDEKTSFLSTYDSVNQRYVFSGMRDYLISLLEKDAITEEDVTFLLIPVDVTYESSSSEYYYGTSTTYVTGIQPYVSGPAMCKLNLDEVKIRFTYSKQSVKN